MNFRAVIRAVALVLNMCIVALGLWLPIRARHLPPSGYGAIYAVLLLAPLSAVAALLWPVRR